MSDMERSVVAGLLALLFGMWLPSSDIWRAFVDGYRGKVTLQLLLVCDKGARRDCEQVRDAAIAEAHRIRGFKFARGDAE